MKLLIIRHGEPDYSIDSLTTKGFKEAELLSTVLVTKNIDYIYCSPLGRAKDTCRPTATKLQKEPVIKEWLREFSYRIDLPGYGEHICWDIPPRIWTSDKRMFDENEWKNIEFYKSAKIGEYYDYVTTEFDKLLANHGYERDGKTYRAVKPNRDTIAIFCHFGLECVLLSRILNIVPTLLWHSFVGLPTSVTTVNTEEREDKIAAFRCSSFGELTHLYVGDEQPSFQARFCETFDGDEVH